MRNLGRASERVSDEAPRCRSKPRSAVFRSLVTPRQLLGGSCLRERAGRWGGELHRVCRSRVLAAVEVRIVGKCRPSVVLGSGDVCSSLGRSG